MSILSHATFVRHSVESFPAYRLLKSPQVILNRLPEAGTTTMVLRQRGMSLAVRCEFGMSVAYHAENWQTLLDRVSGLRTNDDDEHEYFLAPLKSRNGVSLASAPSGGTIDFSVDIGGLVRDRGAMMKLADALDGVKMHIRHLNRLRPAAWLDEWDVSRGGRELAASSRLAEAIRRAGSIRVRVDNGCHRLQRIIEADFVDHDGWTVKVASRGCRAVVYVDSRMWRLGGDGRMRRVSELMGKGIRRQLVA